MGTDSSGKLNVFVSYSHKDKTWLARVQTHLKPLVREGRVELWADTQIKAGERWRGEIKSALARARVAVLLISAEFYASDFIAKNELPPLLRAEEKRELHVLGVHIGRSRFDRDPRLSQYQTVNGPDRPLKALSEDEQDQVLEDLARRIEELLEPPNP